TGQRWPGGPADRWCHWRALGVGGVEGERASGRGGVLGLLAAPLGEQGGGGEGDEQSDDTEDDGSEDRGDAGGGEEPDDGTSAARAAGGDAGAHDAEAGFGVGRFHAGQPGVPKRPAGTVWPSGGAWTSRAMP